MRIIQDKIKSLQKKQTNTDGDSDLADTGVGGDDQRQQVGHVEYEHPANTDVKLRPRVLVLLHFGQLNIDHFTIVLFYFNLHDVYFSVLHLHED